MSMRKVDQALCTENVFKSSNFLELRGFLFVDGCVNIFLFHHNTMSGVDGMEQFHSIGASFRTATKTSATDFSDGQFLGYSHI